MAEVPKTVMQEDPKPAEFSSHAEPRQNSWRVDWFAPLPAEKQRVFDLAVSNLNICYSMMSVVLDEAFCLRGAGELVRARAQAGVSADLAKRFAERLLRLFETLGGLGPRMNWSGELRPVVAPLNADLFRHEVAQHAARGLTYLHFILLFPRVRFLLKLHTLKKVVHLAARHFQQLACDIADGTCVEPMESWRALEALHDDLNLCLREGIVQLKYVLRALPIAHVDVLFDELVRCPEATVRPALEVKPAGLRSPSLHAST